MWFWEVIFVFEFCLGIWVELWFVLFMFGWKWLRVLGVGIYRFFKFVGRIVFFILVES